VLQYLAAREARNRPQARRIAQFAWAVLGLVFLAAAIYLAHWIGIFSVPLVAVVFAGVGIPLRAMLAGTKASRSAAETGRIRPRAARLWSRLELPVLFFAVAAIAVLGILVGGLIGPH